MTILEALALCKLGKQVRPVCWGYQNPYHWIKAFDQSGRIFFAEVGEMEEMPHALRLESEFEFLGEWEVKP